jgi:hypothetical protein
MGRRGPKPRPVRHQYTEEHRQYILTLKATGKTYPQIATSFNRKYNWTPDKGTMSKIIKRLGMRATGGQPEEPTTQLDKTNGTGTGATPISTDKKKAIDTILVRSSLIAKMVNLIQAETVTEGDKVRDITDTEKIHRLQALVPSILKGLDGIDLCNKVMAPTIIAQNVTIGMSLETITEAQFEELLPQIVEKLCSKCQFRRKVIEVNPDGKQGT